MDPCDPCEPTRHNGSSVSELPHFQEEAQDVPAECAAPAFLLPTSTLLARGCWDDADQNLNLEPQVFVLTSTLLSHDMFQFRGRSPRERKKHLSRCSSIGSAPAASPRTRPFQHSPNRHSRASTKSRTLSSASSESSPSLSPSPSSDERNCERQPLDAVGAGLRRYRRERHRQATAARNGWLMPQGRNGALGSLVDFSLSGLTDLNERAWGSKEACGSNGRPLEHQDVPAAAAAAAAAAVLSSSCQPACSSTGRGRGFRCASQGAMAADADTTMRGHGRGRSSSSGCAADVLSLGSWNGPSSAHGIMLRSPRAAGAAAGG